MNKRIITVIIFFCICCTFSGCGKSVQKAIAGTWYSDRDDQSVLTLKTDGTYSDGIWLTSGDYTIDGDKVVLTSALDGTITLLIKANNGETTLYFENDPYSHTYYTDSKQAQAAREERQEVEQNTADKQIAAEQKTLKEVLPGYWYNSAGYPIEFTADGDYISYPLGKQQQGKYKVLSGNSISVIGQDGTEQTIQVKLTDNQLNLNGGIYSKATLLDLSLDLLAGEWTDGTLTTIFTEDGNYVEKSAFTGFVGDTVVAFTITGSNTINVPDQDGNQWAFLSETEREYQLILGKTKNGASYTVFLTKAK